MSPDERTQIARAWIEHSTRKIVRDEHNVFREDRGQDHFDAWEELNRLCLREPEDCWEIILEIMHTPHHESVDWNLAAGPLEDLLAHHGPTFIDRIEALASADPQFKDLLGSVWQNATIPAVWERIEAVRGEP